MIEYCCQQKVLCNWGSTLKQSSAVHIQASYSADGILPGSSSKFRLLVINLASVPDSWLIPQNTKASNVVRKPVDPFMKEKKLIFLSGAIPIIFISLIVFRQFLENNFRGSMKYRYIYSYGSTISLFIQLFLILISFLLALYILFNRKRYKFWTCAFSFILSSSVFLYVTIMFLIGFMKTSN